MNNCFPFRPLSLLAAAGVAAGLCAAPRLSGAAETEIGTRTLLAEMTDLRRLAEFPSPAYTTHQFSSYDRRSKAPGDGDWFANDDWGKFLREEERDGRKEQVMMDAKGPGALVRIWSANPSGTLRIYLDGSRTPAVEAKMEDLLDGKVAGFPEPLAGVRARGHNLYFPVAYAQSCKITCDEGKPYYLVNYRTYPAGTPVRTFRPDVLKSLGAEIQETAADLRAPRAAGVRPDKVETFRHTLDGGQSIDLASLKGSRAITQLVIRPRAEEIDTALRAVVVRMTFDGNQTVEAPLGDFFGAAPGLNTFATLPVGGTDSGELWSHWVMPFRSSARIQLANLGKQPVALEGQIGSVKHRWTPNSMHFSAGYIARYDMKTRPMIDLTHLQAEGKGVFAGLSLAVDNPVKAWWGEGDEKIYVDGEQFPSFFGTGTEDYFGYAWCDTGWFSHAYHAQPRTQRGPANYGKYSNNRFHIIDAVPFTKSLKFDMELWHWEDRIVNMATVAYWYAVPGSKSAFAPLKNADLVVREIAPYTAPRVAGALEGEEMEVVRATAVALPQDWPGLSGESQLWWRETPKPGDTLTLRFKAPKAGSYRVLARFLKARDYGIHQLAINGKKTGDPIDFYQTEVGPTGEIDLGSYELKAGANDLTVTVIGANPRAVKGYMFGLDYLMLKPAPANL